MIKSEREDYFMNGTELPWYTKKSFAMPFGGGEIWFEHLDGIYEFTDLAISKLNEDYKKFKSPSMTSLIAINLDETVINDTLIKEICEKLVNGFKYFTKVVFVGVDKQTKKRLIQELFTAAECDEDFIYFLKDRDKCTYIEGKLGNMVTGLSGEIELEDFVANLVWRDTEKEGLMPIYSIVQGESTAYYVSDIYAEVEFYSNADNNYDTKLQISLLPSGKIGEDSITWIYLND